MNWRKMLLTAFVLFGMAGGFDYSYAMQFGTAELKAEPYLKGGTIAWDQLGGIGGHKFIVAGGINTDVKFNNNLGVAINLEKWWVEEGLDDDEGIIPKEGYSIFTDVKYFLKTDSDLLFYPYAGIGFEEWNKGNTSESWKSLKFFNWVAGIGVEHEKGYIKAGITRPFSVNARDSSNPTPRFGFTAEGGIKLKAFLVGLFYKYAGFEDPDGKMTQSGLFIGYRFK
ncbi:MAG: hypothetical protein CVV37_03470 [Nitrospira bacterium HGW-Nitrospira-1]|nr:MAG: hypothetical protein CVV37_03470 [Nitrospira bacterium HGW-Nitrospira-1]